MKNNENPPQALLIKSKCTANHVLYEKNALWKNHKRGNTISAAGAVYKKQCTSNHVSLWTPLGYEKSSGAV